MHKNRIRPVVVKKASTVDLSGKSQKILMVFPSSVDSRIPRIKEEGEEKRENKKKRGQWIGPQ